MNFSKSGVGWSTGFKGFRYTKKANGGTRTTNTISGTGISYVKDYPDKTKSKNSIEPDINNMSPNKKKPYKNWLIVFAIILTIVLIFKLNLFKLLGSIGLIYVLYIASYKYILKRKPPYALPANKTKFLRTRWIAILTLILFSFGAANSPSPASGQDTQQNGTTLTDNNKHSNSAKSIAKSESVASSKSESESIARSESIASSKSESESTARTESIASSKSESESIKKAEEASESVAKKASSESAQRVAESNSIAESKAIAAQAASESTRQASTSAAQQKSTAATNNAAASTNNTTGIRWAVEDGYTWATRKGHSRRLSPGEPLPSGYHYQTGN